MTGRPEVRGGAATRGFPPGSAQALAALVLGVVAAVVGVRRDQPLLAAVFVGVALVAAVSLVRAGLLRRVRRRSGRDG